MGLRVSLWRVVVTKIDLFDAIETIRDRIEGGSCGCLLACYMTERGAYCNINFPLYLPSILSMRDDCFEDMERSSIEHYIIYPCINSVCAYDITWLRVVCYTRLSLTIMNIYIESFIFLFFNLEKRFKKLSSNIQTLTS